MCLAVKLEAPSLSIVTPTSQCGKAKVKQLKQEPSSSLTLSFPTPLMPETGLPLFINQKWLATILPTLYHCLYVSKESFVSFVKGSPDFMEHITKILDSAVIGHTYAVTPSSAYAKRVHCFYLVFNRSHVSCPCQF